MIASLSSFRHSLAMAAMRSRRIQSLTRTLTLTQTLTLTLAACNLWSLGASIVLP